MKTITKVTAILMFLAAGYGANAQAWSRDSKVIAIGVGGSDFIHFDPNLYYSNTRAFTRVTGQFNLQGEFGVQKWVGLGFTTGVGGSAINVPYHPEVNMPIGMICNFHFYQLIADKTTRNIRADRLDIYGGISIGSGFAAIYNNYRTPEGFVVHSMTTHALFFAGPQLGLRYFVTPTFGVNAEAGWGKSFVNAGFVFNVGHKAVATRTYRAVPQTR
jgi:hypothetical protein